MIAILSGNELTVAHVGDCKIIIQDSSNKEGFIELSKDHKPSNPEDKERILQAGG